MGATEPVTDETSEAEAFLADPGHRVTVGTPWRDRVAASALRRERRVFGLRNAIGA